MSFLRERSSVPWDAPAFSFELPASLSSGAGEWWVPSHPDVPALYP